MPVTPADHEMVAGAMTEAEVFQKYGLEAEALAQLRRIAERFPGFVPAQEKLVQVLYAGSDRGALQRTLVALAMARRAAGHLAGARKAALEAEEIGPLGEEARRGLEESGLLAGSGAATTPAAASVAPSKPAPPERIAPKAASPPPAPPPASELVIEFEEEVETPEPEPEPVQEVEAPAAASVPADPLRLDEEDLFSITEALERDLAPEGEEDAPQVDREKTLEEVVDQFRKHVEEEVGRDDFRTHYDLGIAYKEMGLLDEALEAFRIATGAPSLYRDACSMLALCCRERGDLPAAVDWYERALDAPDPADDLAGLRYDLAEVLEEAGEARRAYELFRAIAETAPAYRDARGRADALRTRLGG